MSSTLFSRAFTACLFIFLLLASCSSRAQVATEFQYPLFSMPAVSRPVGEYEASTYHGYHLAIDLPAAVGTTVHSIADGIVKYSGSVSCLGQAVHIEHTLADNTRVVSVYYHIDPPNSGPLAVGRIDRNTIVGKIKALPKECGTGPHLHFGIRRGGYQGGTDPRTERWFYPGYSSIFLGGKRVRDRTDSRHATILAEWELDPLQFIKSRISNPLVAVAEGLNNPSGLAIDGNYLYFGEQSGAAGPLRRVLSNSTNGSPETVAPLAVAGNPGRGVDKVVFTATDIYFGYGGYSEYRIDVSPRSPGAQTTRVSFGGGYFLGAINGFGYYAYGFCCIARFALGSNEPPETVLGSNSTGYQYFVRASSTDATSIYFYEYNRRSVYRLDAATLILTALTDPLPFESNIFIDATNLYINDVTSLRKMSKQGGASVVLPTGSGINGHASDGQRVYFSQGGALKTVPVNAAPDADPATVVKTVVPAASVLWPIVSGGSFYWVDQSGGVGTHKIWRATP